MDGAFTDKIHKLNVRVYYEDTDFSGVVYHANYLKFAERGRSSFLRLAGVIHSDLLTHEPPLAFVVRGMNIEFVAPARIDDVLVVETIFTAARARADRLANHSSRWGIIMAGRNSGGLH